MRVGGPADRCVAPSSAAEVAAEVRRARDDDAPLRVLGRGSNVVVGSDGVDGTVLRTHRLRGMEFGRVGSGARDAARVVDLRVAAGTPTAVLVAEARRRGIGGLLCLVGYPATIGGAVRMNAGGRWGEIGERVVSVVVVDRDGETRELSAAECGFGYRTSRLGTGELRGGIVVEVRLRLPVLDPETARAQTARVHAEKAAVQPLHLASAGCVFRNPEGESAGRLIDRAGLLGRSVGEATVSTRHGNFFVNRGGARGDDVLRLIDVVRAEVSRSSGVELVPEVEVWRRAAPPGAWT